MFFRNTRFHTSDEMVLWRYMSYSKFQSLLESSSLYFCRIDCFEDKLEATQPAGAMSFAVSTNNPWQIYEKMCTDKQLEIYRKMTFANCWHMNPDENIAMWENYATLQGNEGIAIQTCFGDLAKSFITDRKLTSVEMKYIDYSTQYMNYFMPDYIEFLSVKDKKYSYENELRIITIEESYPVFDPDEMYKDKKIEYFSHKGELIQVDLSQLIHRVYLSPNSTPRFHSTISQLLHTHGLDVPIVKSAKQK